MTINPMGWPATKTVAMSAWYVMSAMGFYAVDPISGTYVFGTPLFDKVVIDLGHGKEFVLQAERSSPADKYIESIALNGARSDRLWFRHEDLSAGGRFVLKMGPIRVPNSAVLRISHRLRCHLEDVSGGVWESLVQCVGN